MKAKLGIAPIAWWNDDLAELSDDVSLEECLRQASVAGFTGMETGRRFPMDMAELGPILKKYGISVCGGWFSGLLLDGDIEVEKDRIATQLAFFKAAGAPCIVYGETARSVQGVKSAPLSTKPKLSAADMTKVKELIDNPGADIGFSIQDKLHTKFKEVKKINFLTGVESFCSVKSTQCSSQGATKVTLANNNKVDQTCSGLDNKCLSGTGDAGNAKGYQKDSKTAEGPNTVLIIILSVIGLAIFGAAAYFVWNKYFRKTAI